MGFLDSSCLARSRRSGENCGGMRVRVGQCWCVGRGFGECTGEKLAGGDVGMRVRVRVRGGGLRRGMGVE